MLTWVPYTFVRFLFLFVAGIVLGIFLPGLISADWIVIILLASAILYFLLVFFKDTLRIVNSGVIGFPLLIIAGYALVFIRTESNRADRKFVRQRAGDSDS